MREGVTNVIRHGDGRQCEIEVHRRDGSVTVTVRGDGGTSAAGPAEAPPPEESTARGPSGGHGLKRNYLSSAIGKTRARNRIGAAETARRNGWL